MIQVSEKQSRLSGWGHYAEPTALFINKVPDPFMVGDTIDISATLEPGGTELHFSDGTILSYRQGSDLLPALENVSVWSVPDAGTVVPNNLDNVTIYASYTTKHGKTINAVPVKVPVAIPSYMRFIVPEEPLIDEGAYLNINPTWFDGSKDGIKSRFMKNASLVVYWTNAQGELVSTSEVTSNAGLRFFAPFTQSTNELIMGEKTGSHTFVRYRSVEDEGEEITLENCSNRFRAEYTIKNITLVAETYCQTNPIISWGFYDMPDSYSGEETVTLDIQQHSKVKYKNGKTLIGRYADNGNYYLSRFFRTQTIGGWWNYYTEQIVTLSDNRTGSVGQYCFRTYRDSDLLNKVSNKRIYNCADGKVTWTEPA